MGDGDFSITWLVDAAATGDERAWQEIVDRYTPLLASVMRRFRLTQAETQDLAQTVWLRLVEHLGSLREPRALPTWIITTVTRESLRYLSDRRRSMPYDPLDPSWLALSTEDADPVEELAQAERHEALLGGLAELPARQRDLLRLLLEDPPLSYAQISERTGIPHGSIGPTRGRALERLRQTFAVRDHVARSETAPAAPNGDGCLNHAAAPASDRPRNR
jgi:RNA polymerase sigma factor (sigma-70 family)